MNQAGSEMENDELDSLGPLLGAIGGEGAAIVGGSPEGLYVFAEVNGGAVFAAVFRDEGTVVRHYDPTPELFELIRKAWSVEPLMAKRWVVMEYEIRDTKFDARLLYPEELNADEDATDRRRAALKRRYGDKQIIYRPIPDDFMEYR